MLCFAEPGLCSYYNKHQMSPTEKNNLFSDSLLKNDFANQHLHSNVVSCGKCKLCLKINTAKLITNDKLNITEKKGTENCKKREVIYAAQCSKHKGLHIGQTGEQLPERSSTHPYDIKNSKLAKHFRKSHNINGNLNITILQNDNQNCSRTKVS